MGALSVTWDDHYRAPFKPLVPDVTFVPADDVAALRAAVTDRTAAVIVEPIQGKAVSGRCRRHGRRDHGRVPRNRRLAHRRRSPVRPWPHRPSLLFVGAGLQPDLMAIGKSLGAGVPIAAALFSERVASAAAFGDHGSTYGGNLLACRAALVFLDELVDGGLMAHVARVGAHLEAGLHALAARHPVIREIRGAGLIWGLELDRPAAPVVDAAIQHGLLVNRTADTVMRLLPPYIITAEEIDEAIGLLDAALIAAFGGQQG